MSISTSSNQSSERQAFEKIFKLMVEITQSQKKQIESLVRERNVLADRLKSQHEKWAFDVKVLEKQVDLMKRDLTTHELWQKREAAKAALLMGMKEKEALMYKLKFEDAEDERNDFKALFEELSSCLSGPTYEDYSEQQRCRALENDVKRLKIENMKLRSTSSSEVITKSRAELELANEKIKQLLTALEESQSSIIRKDTEMVRLKSDVAKLESDSMEKKKEISRLESDLFKKNKEVSELSRELELLTKSRSYSATPILRHCTVKPGLPASQGKKKGLALVNVTVIKDPHSDLEKGSRGLKRKAVDAALKLPVVSSHGPLFSKSTVEGSKLSQGRANESTSTSQTPTLSGTLKRKAFEPASNLKRPKLFSSGFKVPKLKAV